MVDTKTSSVDVEAIKAKHWKAARLRGGKSGPITYVCNWCDADWPCHSAAVVIEVERLQAQVDIDNICIGILETKLVAMQAVVTAARTVRDQHKYGVAVTWGILNAPLARLAAADVPVGPGDAQQLRDILCQASEECQQEDCQHCRIAGLLLGRMTGPLLYAAGPGYIACAKHGIQLSGHTCDWGSTYKIEDRSE